MIRPHIKKIYLFFLILALLAGSIGVYFALKEPNYERSSPITNTRIDGDSYEIEVIYSSPSKKGRNIFGELVPYKQVWRTGANEATLFKSNVDLQIGGQTLKAGKYTLWTIPDAKQWTVIWNKKMYPWGVDFNAQAMRQAKFDALTLVVPVQNQATEEKFSIQLSADDKKGLMRLSWDSIRVEVPFTILP